MHVGEQRNARPVEEAGSHDELSPVVEGLIEAIGMLELVRLTSVYEVLLRLADILEQAVRDVRVRKLVLYYYMEDDTIQINEPKVENSGIPQGDFVKRHQIPHPDGGVYKLHDLYLGAELSIYGRVLRIVDADAHAKRRYEEFAGEPLRGEAEAYPADKYTLKRERVKQLKCEHK